MILYVNFLPLDVVEPRQEAESLHIITVVVMLLEFTLEFQCMLMTCCWS